MGYAYAQIGGIGMPRRNKRSDIEAHHANEVLGDDYRFTRDEQLAEVRRAARQQRAKQAAERTSQLATDWTKCVVPGCQFQTQKRLDSGIEFPVCSLHAAAVWHDMQRRLSSNDERTRVYAEQATAGIQARTKIIIEANEEQVATDEAEHRAMLKSDQVEGDIYYVRTNGLIKVGWSSNLHNRLRTYGPAAELLCHYPGYRRDETELHRQLTPCRAKGREWYVDGDITATFIAEAIAKHGPPTVKVRWTEAKEVVAHTIMRR